MFCELLGFLLKKSSQFKGGVYTVRSTLATSYKSSKVEKVTLFWQHIIIICLGVMECWVDNLGLTTFDCINS